MNTTNQPLTMEDIEDIMNDMYNSSSCFINYKDGIISGSSDKSFSGGIRNICGHIGEITYDEILRNVDDGDDEFYIKIKLHDEFLPVTTI